jgi:hypothetical protein
MWMKPLCAGSALLSVRFLAVALLIEGVLGLSPSSQAGPTTFTYQGQLKDGADLANGEYDLKFSLWTGPITPPALLSAGPIEIEDVSVVDGLFTVQLDLGASFGTFDCSTLWLEVAARPGDSVAAHTVLTPRQEVTPAPQAMFACVAKRLLLPYYESVAMPAPLFELINTGGGKALRLEVDNATNSANALEVITNGDSSVRQFSRVRMAPAIAACSRSTTPPAAPKRSKPRPTAPAIRSRPCRPAAERDFKSPSTARAVPDIC